MTNAAWFVLLIAALLVLLCGVYLSYLNWNENVLSNGISVFLGAAVAFLVTVLSGLKAESLDSRFVALVVLDGTGMPAVGGGAPFPDRLVGKLITQRGIADSAAAEIAAGSTIAARARAIANPKAATPEEDAAAFAYTADLLQFALLKELQTLRPKGGVSVQVASDIQFLIRPTVEALLEPLPHSKIEGLSTNPFSASREQLDSLMALPIHVPAHTKVALAQADAGRVIRFSRSGYYELRITLKSLGSVGMAPKLYRSLGPDGQLRSYPYEIQIEAQFDRLASGSEYTGYIKTWTQALIGHLRAAAEYVAEEE